MTHYVLFKLQPNYSVDEMQELFDRFYAKLPEEISEVTDVSFNRNVIVRDSNMDVMIKVDCRNEDGLYKYLNHPLHERFIEKTHRHIASRVSFDCTER